MSNANDSIASSDRVPFANFPSTSVSANITDVSSSMFSISAENAHLKEKNETLQNLIKDYTLKYKEKEIQLTKQF